MAPLIIAGPTASGKSALALSLAQHLRGEIISCDSVQVYRGFDIGSAKATEAERTLVPHHLIDCCTPADQYHAARFRDEAWRIINDLQQRQIQPILAGGTTLYLSALLNGLSEFPESDPKLRRQLQDMPPAERYRLLQQKDPERAKELHPHDTVRIVRALEIVTQTGMPVSMQRGTVQPLPALVINLCVDPAILSERISQRTTLMIEHGLIAEVRELLAKSVPTSAAPFTTVGYREALQFLNGESSEVTLHEDISAATRRLAKRQRTFWRNEPQKRGWIVKPELNDSAAITVAERSTGSRGKMTQKGFSAFQLTEEELQQRIRARFKQPLNNTEVWHVLLRE
jgi:tRNA dimethylallyltransferase